jgi:MFS transporter, PAT family, beta-lactamase induction signal transducer AmpG
MTPEKPAYKHPLYWVPSSYLSMGIIYAMVTTASNVMFKNLGLPNEKAALYSSLTGFAYSFKPFWAPLLELYKTKKFFVLLMQIVVAALFLGVAFSLKLPSFVLPVVSFMMLAAIAGATLDVGSDGVYVTTLDSKKQATFTGFQSMCWNLGPILTTSVLIGLVGYLAGERHDVKDAAKPPPAAYGSAWFYMFIILAVVMIVMMLWHVIFLPPGSKAENAPKSIGEGAKEFWKAFVTFFQKKDVWLLIGFAFFFRAGYGLLDKITPLFLLDSRANGGLGLQNTDLAKFNGIGIVIFIIGSLVGGWFVGRRGLKKSLLFLALAMNVPNVTMLYLGWVRPESFWVIGTIICIEKLGWGFGAVGHMIYMMQQIAPGPYKTAHYAFATGLGLSLCMTLMGIISGYLQTAVGYQTFFLIVLAGAIPSVLFSVFAPFHHSDGSEATEET